jgi:hypothetical protein
MLQNPRLAFRDPYLQRVVVERDARNQPRPWSGAFAVVYKVMDPDRRQPFAVRVFTTESPERRERYDLISEYLKTRRPRCLVDFEYRERSIRSAGDGKWYPLILMEWVQGETLFTWVREQCQANNAQALAAVAERWLRIVQELADACVAHGDLQHANVMVTEQGELKLVDYDCMCVPSLVGRRNLEVGVEPYQHPGRNERTLLSLDLDNFSALVIYVALRALAVRPTLWQRHVEATGYDRLLFRREDILAPEHSALSRELLALPDPELRELANQMFALARAPLDQVPPLGQLVNSYGRIEQLLKAGHFEEAVGLLNRRGHFRDAPAHLKPLIQQAYEQVCRQRAWAQYRKVPDETSETNDRNLINSWNERLFAGFEPAERERIRVGEARRRVAAVERLRYLAQQLSDTVTFAGEKSLVEAAAKLPMGYRHSLSARVEQARRRVAALSRFEQVVRTPSTEAAIVAAWRSVVEAGCEHLVDTNARQRVALAERRAPLLRALGEVPADLPAPSRLAKLRELWDEQLLADCREAERWRAELSTALGTPSASASQPSTMPSSEQPSPQQAERT